MPQLPIRCALALALALPSLPVQAETLDQLDALADVATDEAGGIAFARSQAERGQFLEALSTLERVLGTFPTSRTALLDHAIYLCEVDDRQGGRVELQLLRERDYDARQLSDARAICDGAALAPAAPPPPVEVAAPVAATTSANNPKPKVN